MGKPFTSELNALKSTYLWALSQQIDELVGTIAKCVDRPLIAVGSGGSLTAANFIAKLHEHYTGHISRTVTPLELSSSSTCKGRLVVLFSASGNNPDIISGLKSSIAQDADQILVLCLRERSLLSQLSHKYRQIRSLEFSTPFGKDGFLATNSLLTMMTMTLRAYAAVFDSRLTPPDDFGSLLNVRGNYSSWMVNFEKDCGVLWNRTSIAILYGPSTSSAAIDIESKFTEAALFDIHTSDYRNFAHGRHHWFAKNGSRSAVVALVSPEDSSLAKKTIQLLPKEIPVLRIATSYSGFLADLSLTVKGFHFTKLAGDSRGIDPGRPGVPRFGSQLFRLNVEGTLSRGSRLTGLTRFEQVAIERKTQTSIALLRTRNLLPFWKKALRTFIQSQHDCRFRTIVFDYDGTLCDDFDRFRGIGEDVSRELTRLLEAGVTIGIATGRGSSVRDVLKRNIDKRFWDSVFVGYYNCSEIGKLSEKGLPDRNSPPIIAMRDVEEELKRDQLIRSSAEVTYRQYQITVEPKYPSLTALLWNHLCDLVNRKAATGVKLVKSTHSFDVIPTQATKNNIVNHLRQLDGGNLLCIGDSGQFPGNDYELLRNPYSLSVAEISPNPSTCWNLAPPGCYGVQANLWYLKHMVPTRRGIRFERFATTK